MMIKMMPATNLHWFFMLSAPLFLIFAYSYYQLFGDP